MQVLDHSQFHQPRRAAVVVLSHPKLTTGETVLAEPLHGVPAAAFRPARGVDHGEALGSRVMEHVYADFERNISRCRGEKIIPSLRSNLDVMQPMPNIGQDPVYVEHHKLAHVPTVPAVLATTLEPMGLDYELVMNEMPKQVPMVGTLNIEYLELGPGHALLRMPDQREYHNHIGGIHAGAMFTLAETASGAIVLAEFGDRFNEYVPLAVTATIRYLKVALGPLTAEATMDTTPAEVIAQLEAGVRPEFNVVVAIRDEAGTQTGEMTIVWTLKRVAQG